ncbi:MAG: sugar ABC transporter substrate-binding protein [Lentisphaerae bacterium RIFOXYB12_FULL_65_16]|nr:MAG: sugar ABC transporter substrate-binding protein [Lentisphaerae bacterium RIFOXYA12_64_32]OGV91285.1 MAG: sugar ABC transporter substrate-binding protein [Lentisphaerae bacterium RIFOXYB12_FULL_65_16]
MNRTSLLCLAVACACAAVMTVRAAEGGKKLKIAVIPKGTTHVFWRSIHAGAVKAGQELGVEVIWQGPQKEDDRKMQIEVVQNFISRRVDAIVLAPLDEVALVRPVKAAVGRGLKVVVIDSDLQGEDFQSFVATDNYQGGRLAAKRLTEVMGGKGKAIMLRYAEGSASTMKREQGFLDEMKESASGIELVSTNQYGGVTAESAFQASQNLLNRFGEVDGVFCPNESTTFGMLRALKTAGKAGKIKFVGFDSSEPLITGLRAGEIQGLTVQNPFLMGYTGVKTAVAAVKGEAIEKRVDTGVVMVTGENIDKPEIQDVVSPDLEKWLK